MKEINYIHGQDTYCAFDELVWNNRDNENETITATCVLHVQLDTQQIEKLSRFVWRIYVEILNDFLDDDFDYFEENETEPFPASKRTISGNPLLIDDYFRKSILWRNYTMDKFLFNQDQETKPTHFVTRYKSAGMKNGVLQLSFCAREIKP